MMNEQENVLVGKVGLGISVILWVLCTWRLGFHSCWCCYARYTNSIDGEENSTSQDADLSERIEWEHRQRYLFSFAFTRRRAFHALLWIATLIELISYAGIARILPFTPDRLLAENIGYFLLNVVGRTFELLAFCIVTEIWLRTAIDARPEPMNSDSIGLEYWLNRSTYVFASSMALLVTTSVSFSVIDFCRFPHATNHVAMPLLKFQTVIEGLCWGIHMLAVALAIGMTSSCVLVLVPSTEWKRRLSLLSKAVGPMFVSFLAYGTRCGWLISAYVNQSRRDSWAWWIGFVWLPTVSVSAVLLYSTRKRDHDVDDTRAIEDDIDRNDVDDNSDSDLQESLLRPQPPEEAFRAFHIFRRGEEDPDDSFSLGSPAPRNIKQSHVEEESETV